MHSLAIKLAVVSTLAFLLHGEGKAQVSIEPSASSVPRPSVLPAAPLKSPSPQEVAAQAFATDVARLSEEADAVDRLWHAYKAQCGARGGRRHDFGREWFALWDRSFEPTLATPACGELLSRLLQSGNSLRRELLETRAMAGRVALTPGTEVGMLRWHSLQWPEADPAPRGQTVGNAAPRREP